MPGVEERVGDLRRLGAQLRARRTRRPRRRLAVHAGRYEAAVRQGCCRHEEDVQETLHSKRGEHIQHRLTALPTYLTRPGSNYQFSLSDRSLLNGFDILTSLFTTQVYMVYSNIRLVDITF